MMIWRPKCKPMIEQALAQRGYVNYETSAFARPGQESRHNMNYWLFGDYLGIRRWGAQQNKLCRQDSAPDAL